MSELENIANKLLDKSNTTDNHVQALSEQIFTIKDQQSKANVGLTKLEGKQETFEKLWDSEIKHIDDEIKLIQESIKDIKKTAWQIMLSFVGALCIILWFYFTLDIQKNKDFQDNLINIIQERQTPFIE